VAIQNADKKQLISHTEYLKNWSFARAPFFLPLLPQKIKTMRKILAYPISIVHYLLLITILSVFHILQVVAFNLFGYNAHKRVVDALNFCFAYNVLSLLCPVSFYGFKNIPKNRPLIIVSNHQSMYDISPIGWVLRKHHPKFISKKELGKNLPSVSYNLHKGGSVLIDRGSGSQSIKEILKLGKKMEEKNWSVCLFPEGTRSKTGELKAFQAAGFKTLLKASPSALIVPFVIDGNYKLHKWGSFPLNIGVRLKYSVLEPMNRENFNNDEELLEAVRNKINNKLNSL
jgi:1-acyl-sn-glycerol-3-phosphate acyltransferase